MFEHTGRTFGELAFYFPDAIVFGLSNHLTRICVINPPSSTFVEAGDEILLIRPTSVSEKKYKPLKTPKKVDVGKLIGRTGRGEGRVGRICISGDWPTLGDTINVHQQNVQRLENVFNYKSYPPAQMLHCGEAHSYWVLATGLLLWNESLWDIQDCCG